MKPFRKRSKGIVVAHLDFGNSAGEKPDHGEESYRGSDRLSGHAALITGGDSGIGKAVAIAFAREGADVAISYLPEEEEDARGTERWICDAGRNCLMLPGGIGQENHCREIVDRVSSEFGRLNILVNNAAYQMTHQKLDEFSSEEWDHVPHQYLRDVLSREGGFPAHETRQHDHQYGVCAGVPA
jgi:hypothetical protein